MEIIMKITKRTEKSWFIYLMQDAGSWMVKNRQVGLTILKRRNTNTPPGTAPIRSSVN